MCPFALCLEDSTATEAGSTGGAPVPQPSSETKEATARNGRSDLVPILLAFFRTRLLRMSGRLLRRDLPHLLARRTLDRLGAEDTSRPQKDVVLRVALEELHGIAESGSTDILTEPRN